MSKIKVIVTGGAGFIGSHLTDALVKKSFEVHVIDNLSTGKKENINPKAIFHKADIRQLEKIKPIFKDAKLVFHLAALPRVQLSIDDPVLTNKVNTEGTLNILIAARDAKVKRVVYSASSSAYGDQKKLPTAENLPANPLSPYALQKHIGEHYCRIFSSVYGLETVSLRYFNVYGPNMSEKGSYLPVFMIFIKQKKENKPLTIIGDGEQTRCFTNVGDVVRANLLGATSSKVGEGETLNICSDKSYSVNEVAKMIGGPVVKLPVRSGEIKKSWGDNNRAYKLLGWRPKISLANGLKELKKVYLFA